MPDFKRLHEFVTFVHNRNTKDDDEDDATLGNLTDTNYRILKAIKEDNALRKFQTMYKYSNPKVAEIYADSRHLGLIERLDSSNNSRVEGVILLDTYAGKEFIKTPGGYKMGKWLFIAGYYYKQLTIFGVIVVAGLLGNIEHVIRFLRWLF